MGSDRECMEVLQLVIHMMIRLGEVVKEDTVGKVVTVDTVGIQHRMVHMHLHMGVVGMVVVLAVMPRMRQVVRLSPITILL